MSLRVPIYRSCPVKGCQREGFFLSGTPFYMCVQETVHTAVLLNSMRQKHIYFLLKERERGKCGFVQQKGKVTSVQLGSKCSILKNNNVKLLEITPILQSEEGPQGNSPELPTQLPTN